MSAALDPAEVAGRLTKAGRQRLRDCGALMLRNCHDVRVSLRMKAKGLCEETRHVNQMAWTPLGLAVRADLMETDHAD